jgi:formylglycine-generating enzyme required for sulfatase activity
LSPTIDTTPGVGCTADQIDLATSPSLPVVCSDWCDADAFCKSAGKQLCGAIGGGPDAYDDLAAQSDPSKSQWYLACAGEEKRAYPYGAAYVRGACRDKSDALTDAGLAAAAVGSSVGCHGPIGTASAAVFDLSGNVAEWVDACEVSAGDHAAQSCILRGGYFREEDDEDASPNQFLRCDIAVDGELRQRRDHFDDHIGFRCCVSPP